MTYEEALRFIHETSKFGSKLGLTNIRELLTRLGKPQENTKFVHIAGTNGKGSVTALLASVLLEAGYTVGRYTSPFIYEFNERIAVNNVNIDNESLTKLTCCVAEKCKEMVSDGFNHPTEFEIVTAIGMLYFSEKKCDYVVLEVGLGGRLDATNVIDAPLVSVITSVDFDHMEYLGETLTKIAFEKCGIIKNGTPVATYCEQKKEVLDEILRVCAERESEIHIAECPQILKSGFEGSVFSCGMYRNLFIPLVGEHMVKNASLALCTVDILREHGVSIPDEAIFEGFYRVYWPARLEIIGTNPLMIIDGAHNISGMTALADATKKFFPEKNVTLIMGMLRDKEYREALRLITPCVGRIITVTVPSPRTLDAKDLYLCAQEFTDRAEYAESMDEAMGKAFSYGDAILAAGSLYMLAYIRKAYKKRLSEIEK